MKLIKKYCKILHILCQKRVDKKIQCSLLQSPEVIKALSEVAYNILRGNINISGEQKKKLLKYKHILRKLARKQYSCQQKRKIIQRGGGAFLPLLLPVIGSLLASIIK
jgi:3-dehydroquinate synthetase